MTSRELDVASLIVQGLTYKLIAGKLYISEGTVKSHVREIYSKYGVETRQEFLDEASAIHDAVHVDDGNSGDW